jgi:hypothetical protein
MASTDFTKAKKLKNDEFYTQYQDIEKEVNAYLEYNPDVFSGKTILLPCDDPEWSNFTKYFAQNFERFGLKKLISTSYAANSKKYKTDYQPTLFEMDDPQYDEDKTVQNGKIFTLTHDINADTKVNIDDLEWHYLQGDGDFLSDEIKVLRDEADIIITNPPFSLFREFLGWIVEVEKQFLIIGNINSIVYIEVFPLIQAKKAWVGNGMGRWISGFIVPKSYELYGSEARVDADGNRIVATNSCLWLTNIDHGRRHKTLPLMTMSDNLKFSRHKNLNTEGYQTYDNYDAIDVPYTDAIPSDYDGVMGVPISFLDKFSPEQFEIVGSNRGVGQDPNGVYGRGSYINGKETFKRIFIRHRSESK